ncbi:ankyrin repeat-containing domain protein [Cladorrhinum sp. PSN259]|nr:ankyrin repeat-containing domain protein [Cladorrhinum sp. PSN259]
MDAVTTIGLAASLVQLIDAVTKALSFLNDIRNAPKERAELAQELAGLLGLLMSLRFRVDDCKPKSTWFAAVRFLGVPNGPVDQLQEAIGDIAAKVTGPKNQGSLKSAIKWPFQKKDAQRLLAKVERMKSLINLAFQEDLSKLVLSIKADLQMLAQLDTSLESLNEKIEELVARSKEDQERLEKERAEVINWISPLNFNPTQNELLTKRAPNTGSHLLNSEVFTEWLGKKGQTIWCNGIPGAGKTVFAATVVDHLQQVFSKRTDIGIAVAYCNYKETDRQKPVNLLAAIWRQIITPGAALSSGIKLTYKTHQDRGTSLELREISRELREEVRGLARVFIIIDALDECPEDNGVRSTLLEHLNRLLPRANIMVTSRPLDDIKARFQQSQKLKIDASNDDVEQYIRYRILKEGRLRRHVGRDPALEDMIIQEVCSRTQHMFLLAQLHMDALATKPTRRSLENALRTLPKELDQTYEEAMRRIENQNEDDRELAWKILRWIALANRPLKRSEIQHALAVVAGDETFDVMNVPDEELLTSVCAGLVSIDPVDDTVRPIHYTAQEYFERVLRARFQGLQSDVTGTCLTYISFRSFLDHNLATGTIQSQYPFYLYAVTNWLRDFRGSNDVPEKCFDLLKTFLANPQYLETAIRFLRLKAVKYSKDVEFMHGWTSLHVAASLGMDQIVEELLEEDGSCLLATDSLGATCLHIAVASNNIITVELILEHEADINAQTVAGRTPLHLALLNGNRDMTEFLIESGAQLKLADCMGTTALHFASSGGDLDTIRLILAEGAELNATTRENHTPIYRAVLSQREKAVDLLISSFADINIADRDDRYRKDDPSRLRDGRTPLHRAAETGNITVIKSLVKCQQNLEIKDGDGYTPLDYAVMEGHCPVAELLVKAGALLTSKMLHRAVRDGNTALAKMISNQLEQGERKIAADQNLLIPAVKKKNEDMLRMLLQTDSAALHIATGDSHGKSALHWAVGKGFYAGVKLLIEAGADPNHRDHYLETPLHLASEWNQGPIAEFLIQAGAEINAQDAGGETPLHRAAAMNQKAVLNILLDSYGVNPSLLNNQGETLLQVAARFGAAGVIGSLVSDRVNLDVNSRYEDSATPLILASQLGYLGVIKALLANGADQNATDDHGNTALLFAAQSGHTKVVDLLLEKGADPDLSDALGKTAIMLAIASEHFDVARSLIAKGADLNAQDNRGQTAVIMAVEQDYDNILLNLLSAGADRNTKDCNGDAALHIAASKDNSYVITLLFRFDRVLKTDANSRDKLDRTPIFRAAKAHHVRSLFVLLKWYGADPNIQDRDGNTALHVAAEIGCEFICATLIHLGADSEVLNRFGDNPLKAAQRAGKCELKGRLEALRYWNKAFEFCDHDNHQYYAHQAQIFKRKKRDALKTKRSDDS